MKKEIELTEKQKEELHKFSVFSKNAKLILRDMNKTGMSTEFFTKYKREDVVKWLENPSKNEKKLIEISKYCYSISPHYRRICDYFGKMSLLSYIVVPYKLDETNFDKDSFLKDYNKTIDELQVMSIRNEYEKIINEMFITDTVYVYEYYTPDSYFCKVLPPKYCEICSIEDGVFQFQFDFSFFNSHKRELAFYGDEFVAKYKLYERDKSKYRWQQLDGSRSFAMKLSDNIPYSMPIFANLITTIFDLEEIRQLEKAKNKLGVYKLLLMKLPINEDGDYDGDFNKALEYYDFLCDCVDETVGVGMTPYDVKDYSFDKSGTNSQVNNYSDAVTEFFTASGVSELLFNGSKSSSATISNSIKNDGEMLSHINRMIERVINKKLKQKPTKYKFAIKMLDITTYNQKEYIDNLLNLARYGVQGSKTMLPAAIGYTPAEVKGVGVLEECLDYVNKWIPLSSSNTQSGSATSPNEGGAPKKDDNDLSDSGAISRDRGNE